MEVWLFFYSAVAAFLHNPNIEVVSNLLLKSQKKIIYNDYINYVLTIILLQNMNNYKSQ